MAIDFPKQWLTMPQLDTLFGRTPDDDPFGLPSLSEASLERLSQFSALTPRYVIEAPDTAPIVAFTFEHMVVVLAHFANHLVYQRGTGGQVIKVTENYPNNHFSPTTTEVKMPTRAVSTVGVYVQVTLTDTTGLFGRAADGDVGFKPELIPTVVAEGKRVVIYNALPSEYWHDPFIKQIAKRDTKDGGVVLEPTLDGMTELVDTLNKGGDWSYVHLTMLEDIVTGGTWQCYTYEGSGHIEIGDEFYADNEDGKWAGYHENAVAWTNFHNYQIVGLFWQCWIDNERPYLQRIHPDDMKPLCRRVEDADGNFVDYVTI